MPCGGGYNRSPCGMVYEIKRKKKTIVKEKSDTMVFLSGFGLFNYIEAIKNRID